MQFEWDDNKAASNLQKHGVDFFRACQIFTGPTVEFEDKRYNYGEERFVALGLADGQVLAVTYTFRDQMIRLISARKATKDERKIYYQNFSRGS